MKVTREGLVQNVYGLPDVMEDATGEVLQRDPHGAQLRVPTQLPTVEHRQLKHVCTL